jgi:hypothetical protein
MPTKLLLKTYCLWVVQKASNFQGRWNRGAEGNCFSPPPKGLADQLTLSQSEGARLCPPNYYVITPQIFRPSYGPANFHAYYHFPV